MSDKSTKNNIIFGYESFEAFFNKLIDFICKVLIVFVIIGLVYCSYLFFRVKTKKDISYINQEHFIEFLRANCNEKLLSINIDYMPVVQRYINKIYEYVKEEKFEFAYWNLEQAYLDKTNISKEQMIEKLRQVTKDGIELNSFEKTELDDGKLCFVCKIGNNNSSITIYEIKPKIYSFAFDGFVK